MMQDTLKSILVSLDSMLFHVGNLGYPEDCLLVESLLKSKEMTQTCLEMVLEDGESENIPVELPKQHSVGIWG